MAAGACVVYDYAGVGAATGDAMNGFFKNRFVTAGATLILLGLLAIAVPVITTQESTELFKLGDTKLVVKEETPHIIPPYVGVAALGFGVVLIAVGVIRRRAD
ncbi:MAG: hypothetical protein AB7T40_13985 [Alphaproteobacteria bacterium]